MYAIVKTGGKQYRVEKGQTLLVERLPEDAGATVSLEPVLFRSDDVVFDPAGLAKVRVDAKVVEHVRGEKLRVFKFKPKRGYRRRAGHRQELTRIEVTEIKQLSRRPATTKAADQDAEGTAKRTSRSGKRAEALAEATASADAPATIAAAPSDSPAAEPATASATEAPAGASATDPPAAEPATEAAATSSTEENDE
jgi:large subunit ribosomal protein L21